MRHFEQKLREALQWEDDSVLLYRGAPQVEKELSKRGFPGVYLTTSVDTAKLYGKYVSVWRLPKSELLDADSGEAEKIVAGFFHRHASDFDREQAGRRNGPNGNSHFIASQIDIADREDMWISIFLYPTKTWVELLKSLGYAGTSNGTDVFVFDTDHLRRVR